MELPGSSKPMIATQEEMVEARVPIPYRDQCAHLLILLNKCRHAEFFLPWKCENERHIYEKCEYELVMERMLQMQKIREAEAKLKQSHKQGTIPLIPKTANA
uniref:NADH dehydrogenase [ubiquinone] 1 beta subcomplex subunit 7 n=1 Tax=Populus davidiana TaxID=266767 RepID=A0A6M2F856_9ROSI